MDRADIGEVDPGVITQTKTVVGEDAVAHAVTLFAGGRDHAAKVQLQRARLAGARPGPQSHRLGLDDNGDVIEHKKAVALDQFHVLGRRILRGVGRDEIFEAAVGSATRQMRLDQRGRGTFEIMQFDQPADRGDPGVPRFPVKVSQRGE